MRRTTIKDASALAGFLVGFLGSAPFAWRYLGPLLEGGDFVRGLWLFFGLVVAAAVIAGATGLGAGVLIGWAWERFHRRRRRSHRQGDSDKTAGIPRHRLRLITPRDADASGPNDEH